MSYLERLQQNNTDLQGLIDKANALPEAGSGGSGGISIETCTVSFSIPWYPGSGPALSMIMFTTTEGNKIINQYKDPQEFASSSTGNTGGGTYNFELLVIKESTIFVHDGNMVGQTVVTSGNLGSPIAISPLEDLYAIIVNGDGSITTA